MSSNRISHISLFVIFSVLVIMPLQGKIDLSPAEVDSRLEKAKQDVLDGKLSTKEQVSPLLEWTISQEDIAREAQVRLLLGRIGWQTREFREGQQQLHRAISLFRQLGDSTGIVASYIEMGTHMRVNQLFDSAFTYYAHALEVTREHLPENYEKLGHANMVMGNVYNNLKLFDKAIAHFDASYEALIQHGDTSKALGALGNKSYTLRQLGRHHEAIEILKEVERFRQDSFTLSITWLQLAEAYKELGNNPTSLQYANKLFDYDVAHKNAFGRLPYCHTLIANALAGLGRHEEAVYHYEISLSDFSDSTLNLEYFADRIYLRYIDYLKDQNRYQRAMEVHERFLAKKEEDFNRNLNGQLADARTKYETDKIEQENRILDLQNKASKRLIQFSLIALLTLAALAIIAWQAYVSSRKQTRLLREAQAQLIQAEKMASLGQLTAGVAHELNNPIAFINGNATALAMDFKELKPQLQQPDNQELVQEMDEAIEGLQRGADRIQQIVSSLRIFSHSANESKKPENLHELLEVTLTILKQKLQHVEIVRELGEIPLVPCEGGSISQVLLNVIDNAAAATPEGGEIHIRSFQQGKQVGIEIRDTGSGMSPETRKKMFDPFFTTKEVGKGTGLGMSISYGIIKDHGGKIQVTSEEGKGTTICILLPI